MILIKKLIVLMAISLFFLLVFGLAIVSHNSFADSAINLPVSKAEKKLDHVIQEQIQNHKSSSESQKKISGMVEQTRDLVHDYRITLRQIESARIYNRQLKKLIQDQKRENVSIRQQIVEIKKTRKEIIPLMLEMYLMLKQFIKNDLPFLKKERNQRLKEIKNIMDRSDVAVSEKYRRLIEAYQIENDYGKSLDAYQGLQNVNGKMLNVHYLRVGRLVLLYQTLDEKHQAYWNQKIKKWIPLSSRYRRDLANALRVAKKQKAPTLMKLPVPPPSFLENKTHRSNHQLKEN